METAIVSALVLAALLGVALGGWYLTANDERKTKEVLSRFDGQDVIIRVQRGDRAGLIVEMEGRFWVGDKRSTVQVIGAAVHTVFLSQIRWIENPVTGDHYGVGGATRPPTWRASWRARRRA